MRRIGLKDIYVSKVTADDATTYTADTPVKLCRAISATVTPNTNTEIIYSDDAAEDVINNFTSYDVEIEGDQLSPEMRELLFGHTFNLGMETDNVNDVSNTVALGYRAKKTDGKYEFVWLYAGKFQDVEDTNETIADSITSQSVTVSGTFYGRKKDGNTRVRVDESFLLAGDTEAATAITNWFSIVQEPLTETP